MGNQSTALSAVHPSENYAGEGVRRSLTGTPRPPARSPADLPIADMRWNPQLVEQGVKLGPAESAALVRGLVRAAEESAERTARAVHHRVDDTAERVYETVVAKQFRKGAKGLLPRDTVRRLVREGAPIPAATIAFPLKLGDDGLKAFGPLPDLAELAALVRFHELRRAVAAIYPPGIDITVFSDGNHFRPRPIDVLRPYQAKLREYNSLVGDPVTIHDLDEWAAPRMDMAAWTTAVDDGVRTMTDALAHVDLAAGLDRALEIADNLCPGGRDGSPLPGFAALFRSLLYTISPPPVRGRELVRQLYADVGDLADPVMGAARSTAIRQAWADTIRYRAVIAADRELRFERAMLPDDCLRLTPHPRAGALGFSYLGGLCILPWHGVGTVEGAGTVSCEFALSAADAGYVPVWSELLGTDQPWFMTPISQVRQGELAPDLLSAIRLRRR